MIERLLYINYYVFYNIDKIELINNILKKYCK